MTEERRRMRDLLADKASCLITMLLAQSEKSPPRRGGNNWFLFRFHE
jgi:hypothetical protein